jgi:hypothetical protein
MEFCFLGHTWLQEFSLPRLCHQTLLGQEHHLNPEDVGWSDGYERKLPELLRAATKKENQLMLSTISNTNL